MHQLSKLNTPFYLYDLDLLNQTLDLASEAAQACGYRINYAIKANNNPVITNIIASKGFGSDCVSGNEVKESLLAGFAPQNIMYAGVGKSDWEIRRALESNIHCFNCESLEELQVIEQLAAEMGKTAPVALRVNPGVRAHTHHYISTGLEENKFGIHLHLLQESLNLAVRSPHIQFMGLHFHIGSQITDLDTFAKLCSRVNEIWHSYNIHRYHPQLLNLGGGLGLNYDDPENQPIADFRNYFSVIHQNLNISSKVQIHFELGRSLTASCGKLITRVLYTKKGVNRNFVVTDAGMTELMRPALYQAQHKIENLSSLGDEQAYDVVGPVCESADVFGKEVSLPITQRGHLLAIHSCGAYAESMSLRYNMRNKASGFFLENGMIQDFTSKLNGKALAYTTEDMENWT